MQSESDENWIEDQYLREINDQPDYGYNYDYDYKSEYATRKYNALRHVWNALQDSATAVTQLYRDRSDFHDRGALWIPFHTAAGTVTGLYKGSSDGIKRTNSIALQCGYQRRTREITDWALRKKSRFIRREDLLAYLAGKPPPRSRRSPKPESQMNDPNDPNQVSDESLTDLHTFKEEGGPDEIAGNYKRPASPSDVNKDISNISNKRQRFI